MSGKTLTLVIVTRKRKEKLRRCLESVERQTILPERVIVIDNDPGQSAKTVSTAFKKSLSLIYKVELKRGVPQSRNQALEYCETDLLGFVDDDCVLDRNWVKAGKEAITRHRSKTAYIVGRSLLLNNQSIIALTQFHINRYWFKRKISKKTNKIGPQALDTKNVVLKIDILRKYKIRFDGRFGVKPFGGWADTDLGLQLAKLGFVGYYESKMVVYHEEIERLYFFLKKAYYRGKTAFLLSDKWRFEEELVDMQELKLRRFLSHFRNLPKEYREVKTENIFDKLILVSLKKLYERVHLQGFADQKRALYPRS